MEPTLHCARPNPGCQAEEEDEITVAIDHEWLPKRGEIVVFRTPPKTEALCGIVVGSALVKRVVGLPGETWEERNGFIYIDGRRLRESYVERRESESRPSRKIPPRSYLALGDNRPQSCDSRIWGPVPEDNLIGRVIEIHRGGETIEP